MTVQTRTPNNINFLSPLNFEALVIKRAPHVDFFLQKVILPDIKLGVSNVNNPFTRIPYPGDHVEFGDLRITFKVDEDFNNYLEIRNWILALGFPETHEQYKEIVNKPSWLGESITSDLSLLPMSSNKMSNYEVIFIDSYPIYLSEAEFLTTDQDVKYITATATFKYTYNKMSKIIY